MLLQNDIRSLPFADNSIDLIFTDPPYLKDYLYCYEWLACEALRVLKPGGFVLAMCGGLYLNKIFRFFDDSGLNYYWEFHHNHDGNAPYIWSRHVIAKSKSILAYCKGTGIVRVKGVQSRFDAKGKMKTFHHWGQDVGSARYYIDHFSAKGQLVLDPFIGGGTTAVACKLIDRRYIGGDIDLVALETTRLRLTGAWAPYSNLPMFEAVQ